MKTKTKLKLVLLMIPALLAINISTAFAAEAEDAPPALSIDFEAPPSLNITIPGEDESDAPPKLNITVPSDGNPQQPPQEQPPQEVGNNNGNPDQPPGNDNSGDPSNIKLTNVSANPKKFNPIIDETRITYKISKQAKIEIKILDSKGQVVATLIDNQTQSIGTHNVNWYGTKNNSKNGEAVIAGTYTYKVTAKNLSGQTKDSKEGTIEIFYGQVQTPKSEEETLDLDQVKATVTLNNSKSGKTAATGPGILIYPLIPLAAWIVQRKFIK